MPKYQINLKANAKNSKGFFFFFLKFLKINFKNWILRYAINEHSFIFAFYNELHVLNSKSLKSFLAKKLYDKWNFFDSFLVQFGYFNAHELHVEYSSLIKVILNYQISSWLKKYINVMFIYTFSFKDKLIYAFGAVLCLLMATYSLEMLVKILVKKMKKMCEEESTQQKTKKNK